jgi:hypothetical protein
MIPAIWIGNFLIVYLYKYLFVKKNINYIVSSAVAVVSKVAVIFAGFNLLALVNVIPQGSKVFEALKVSMGANQLVTASMGAIVSFAIIKLIDLSKKKKVEAEK